MACAARIAARALAGAATCPARRGVASTSPSAPPIRARPARTRASLLARRTAFAMGKGLANTIPPARRAVVKAAFRESTFPRRGATTPACARSRHRGSAARSCAMAAPASARAQATSSARLAIPVRTLRAGSLRTAPTAAKLANASPASVRKECAVTALAQERAWRATSLLAPATAPPWPMGYRIPRASALSLRLRPAARPAAAAAARAPATTVAPAARQRPAPATPH